MPNVFFDGKKASSLDNFPAAAWDDITPKASTQKNQNREDFSKAALLHDKVAFLYRCVQIRAGAITRIPWAVRKGSQDIWLSTDTEPPQDLAYLKSFGRLLRLTETAMCLSPEAFWFIEQNRSRILSLRWHAPQTVIPQWSSKAGLTGFKRVLPSATGVRSRTYDTSDYVYFALPNPGHETIPGRPPGQTVINAASVLRSVDVFATNFFDRGAIKATLLSVEGNPDKNELRRLERWWQQFFQGIKSAWKTVAVRANVTPVIVGEGMESLSQNELTHEKRQDIATALGVPHSLVFSDAANYATATVDNRHFYDKTLIPEMQFLTDVLNDQLFNPHGYSMVLRPDEMSIFQEEEADRAGSYASYISAGMLPSIAASILGIDMPQGLSYSSLDESVTQPPVTQPQEPPVAKAIPALPDSQRRVELGKFRRWAQRKEMPDPESFKSVVLSRADKIAVLRKLYPEEEYLPARGKSFQVGDPEIDTLLLEYDVELRLLFKEAVADHISKPAFEQRMSSSIQKFLERAFLTGVGIAAIEELTSTMQATLSAKQNLSHEAVAGLSYDIFNLDRYMATDDGLSRLMGRALMWETAVAEIFSLGLLQKQSPTQIRYEWLLGNTTDHCSDCLRLRGQVHTGAEWLASGWHPQGRNLACHGFYCDCRLVETTEAVRGKF